MLTIPGAAGNVIITVHAVGCDPAADEENVDVFMGFKPVVQAEEVREEVIALITAGIPGSRRAGGCPGFDWIEVVVFMSDSKVVRVFVDPSIPPLIPEQRQISVSISSNKTDQSSWSWPDPPRAVHYARQLPGYPRVAVTCPAPVSDTGGSPAACIACRHGSHMHGHTGH